MNTSTHSTDALLKALRAAAITFIETLDEATGHTLATSPDTVGGLIAYDPLHDEPPFAPNPSGTEAQILLSSLTYLGAIGRLNHEEGRGALPAEVSEFAKKAGYSGGNAVNGWNSRPASPRSIEMMDGARFLNDTAPKALTKHAAKLGIKIVGEMATVPAAK